MAYRPGYFVLPRTIFDEPAFDSNRPYSLREAWAWLNNAVAWKARGQRGRYGVFHNDCGQLCITHRELGRAWRSSLGRVQRLLRRLDQEGLISLALAQSESKSGANSARKCGHRRTVITICDYERNQAALRRSSQSPSQKASQKASQSPAATADLFSRSSGYSNDDFEVAQGRAFGAAKAELADITESLRDSSAVATKGSVAKEIPPHGAKAKVDGRIKAFFVYRSPEWNSYAAHWRLEHQVEALPTRYLDGLGKWFYLDGSLDNSRKYERARR